MAATNVQTFSGDVEVASNLAVDTNTLLVDSVSNRIGIGTTIPQNTLAAVGNVTFGPGASTTSATHHAGMVNVIGGGTRALLRIENNNSVGSPGIIFGEGGIFTEDTAPTIKKVQGTNNLAITTSGNVGIGTTNPGLPLEVFTGNGANYGLRLRRGSGSAFTDLGHLSTPGTEGLAIKTSDGNSTTREVMRITGTGRVGIGTDNPSTNSILSIYKGFTNPGNGNQTAFDAKSSITWKSNLSTGVGSHGVPSPVYYITLQDVASIFFQPRSYQYVGSPNAGHHGVLHMSAGFSAQSVPDSNNNFSLSSANGLGLGTAQPLSYSLDLYDRTYRSRNSGVSWRFGAGSNSEYYIYGDGTTPANSGVYLIHGGTSWTGHSSDIRTKKNFTTINDALRKIRNIRPVLYHFNHEEDTANKRIGFIAQDWLAQQPECVYHNETLGNLTMSLTETTPVLCAAIKELDSNQQGIQEVVNNLSDFTGQHRCLIKDISPNDYAKYEGLIVSANNNEYLNHDSITKPTINEALPIVSLTNKEKDKTCLGVISLKADPESHLPDDPTRLKINALGEGAVWVTDINGPLQSGDYITSSNIAGYGMRQDDDVIHNYTIAKITQDCDFTKKTRKVKKLVKELKDITYYKFTYKKSITKDEYDVTDESLRLEEDYEYYSRKEIRYIEDDTPGLFDSDAYQRIDDVQSVSKEEYDQNQSLYDKETKYKIKDSDEIVNIDEEIYNLDPSKYDVEVIYTTKLMHLSKEEYDKNPTLYNVIKVKIKEHKCYKDKFAALKDEDGFKHEFKLVMSKKYYKLDKIETKEPQPGYETEVRKELVNVLDENGQLTWIESEETETEYDLRYLTSNGSQTDEANAIHRAAFVGCTYHCG